MTSEKEIDKIYQEAKQLEYSYQKRQRSIKNEVLSDIPNKIRLLEEARLKLKRIFLDKKQELSNQIKLIRANRRKITKEAYLKDKELQQLKRDRTLKWDEHHKLVNEYWVEEERLRKLKLVEEKHDKWRRTRRNYRLLL